MKFNDWVIYHTRSVLLLLMIAVVGGTASIVRLPVGLFPHVEYPRAQIRLDAGVRPAPQMEIEITRPVEEALRAVPGIRNIRSTTSRGSAEISVDFAWGSDMRIALLQLEAKIDQILPQLPPRTSYTARRMAPEVFPVVAFSLISDALSPIQLRDLAEYQIAPSLSAVDGVAHVAVQGGETEEYRVDIDPDRVRAHGLTVADVGAALTSSNVLSAVGRLQDRHRLFLVLSDTRFSSLDQIRHTVVKTGADGIIELEDVATVGAAEVPQWLRVTADGHPAVLLPVYQQSGANTVQIGKDIEVKLKAFLNQLSGEVAVRKWYDQGALVLSSIASVRDAVVIGVCLAGIVLLLFLRSWKITAIGVFAVPLVLSVTGLLLYALGMTINIMTLGGAAAAVGLIIDDVIVVVERIISRLQSGNGGQDRRTIAAARELTRPLMGSSASTIIIFLPLAFLTGVTGAFFKALSLTMGCALLVSLFVAWLIVPLVAEHVLSNRDGQPNRPWSLTQSLERYYRSSLAVGMRHPWLALVGVSPLVVLGYLAFTQVGSGFMPVMDEGGFVLDYRTPAGTSLTETDRVLREISAILLKTPEVETYSRRTGLQLGSGLTEANTGDFFVRLKPLPRRGIADVTRDVRSRVEDTVPGVKIEISQLLEDLIGDLTAVPQPIEVKLFGSDPSDLMRAAPKVAEAIAKIGGIVDVRNGIVMAGDAIEIKVDRDKAAIEGITPQAVTTQVRDYLTGNVASQVEQAIKIVGIRAWIPADYRQTVENIGQLQLHASDGHILPLSRIAAIEVVTGQPEIQRENLSRMIAVTARVQGRSIGTVAGDVVRTLTSQDLIPKNVTYELGGLYKQQTIAMRDMTIVFIAAVMLVFVLLLFLYESFLIVGVIVAMPLLASGAVFIGLWTTGTERNITAMMGLTMVIGVVTEIAIFYFSEYVAIESLGHADRLIQAGVNRFRPIAMTTLAAILALLPLWHWARVRRC